MLRKYVEQILDLCNYIDGLMVTDRDGYVEYYINYRTDVNSLREQEIYRKHVTEVYPGLTEETSSIMRVLRTGKPIFNERQNMLNFKGQSIWAVNTTMPIRDGETIIGAVDVSRYIDAPYERQDIFLSLKEQREVENLYTLDDIVTNAQSMEQIKAKIPMIADTDSSVLLYGETGTGKEMVAQSIHTSSRRKNKKFISQNCAAIPANLLEGILFGTTKGSYTGAENKPGLFEIAAGGTLFLDEINSMEISVQSKLLKAIEEKQVTRLGGYKPIKTDIKIISAVNEDPMSCIQAGRLREDLFYRLSVVQLNIPPLRSRQCDISYLVHHFIQHYNQVMGRNIIDVDEEVEALFHSYSWPGNVRELKNVIEGAFNVADSRLLQKRDLPEYLTRSFAQPQTEPELPRLRPGFQLETAMASYEESMIRQALAMSKNLVEAARLLGITKQALNYKLSKYKLRPSTSRSGRGQTKR